MAPVPRGAVAPMGTVHTTPPLVGWVQWLAFREAPRTGSAYFDKWANCSASPHIRTSWLPGCVEIFSQPALVRNAGAAAQNF